MEGRGGLGKGKRGRERKGEVGDSALVVGGIDAPAHNRHVSRNCF